MEVLQKQKNLYYLNYRGLNGSMLALDGIWGVNSIQATKNFQKDVGLVVDGIWGANTKNEVMKFQKAHDLTADGIAGPKTIAALKKDK